MQYIIKKLVFRFDINQFRNFLKHKDLAIITKRRNFAPRKEKDFLICFSRLVFK